MGSRIRSDLSAWETIASHWYAEDVTSLTKDFTSALQAANEVIAAADSIGYSLSITATQFKINELERRRQLMWETTSAIHTSSIHFEVDALIDNPFTRTMSSLMEDVHALNPKEITISGTNSSGKSVSFNLTDLFLAMITTADPALREDYVKQSRDVIFDEVPSDLEAVYTDALYWQKEYDKMRNLDTSGMTLQELYAMIGSQPGDAPVQAMLTGSDLKIVIYVQFDGVTGNVNFADGTANMKDLALKGFNLWDGKYYPDGHELNVDVEVHEITADEIKKGQQYIPINLSNTVGRAETGLSPDYDWSITHMNLYPVINDINNEPYKYSKDEFQHVAAHELGHVMGVEDAYKEGSPNAEGNYSSGNWPQANPSLYPAQGLMKNDTPANTILSQDIQMVLEAQSTGDAQYYQSYTETVAYTDGTTVNVTRNQSQALR